MVESNIHMQGPKFRWMQGQLELLRSLKCEYGQGYLFSKGVDAEKATALVLEDATTTYVSVDDLIALDPATLLVN